MIINQYKQQNSTIWINLIAHHFFNSKYIDICKCLYDLGTVILKLIQLSIISLQFLGDCIGQVTNLINNLWPWGPSNEMHSPNTIFLSLYPSSSC